MIFLRVFSKITAASVRLLAGRFELRRMPDAAGGSAP